MKKRRFESKSTAIKGACAVSAAALMLGVSHAATIGLHFQSDWTDANAPAYTGFPVTATAFGIPPTSWQNLTPMPTGYNKQSTTPGPFIQTEVIGVTNVTPGLNSLPSGALNVTWTAVASNDSGFGFGGNHPGIGENEVYYGFLRDDVFIYTSPLTTNGYSVTITGLKTVFTNSQYVVQLAASTDSATSFTNAILTSGLSSQNLTYSASRPTFGILGGLSSVSTALTADSITIAGAPALDDRPNSGQGLASTIAGLMITDVPVIQTQPLAAVGAFPAGTNITLSVTAFGVPPLGYQWRKGGIPIPGATTTNYAIASVGPATAGVYDVVVTNQYGSATSAPAPVTASILVSGQGNILIDSKPGPGTEHDAYNSGGTWLASSKDANSVMRTGVLSFSSLNPGRVVLPAETDFTNSTGTISFWMRSPGTETNSAHQGSVLFEDNQGASGLRLVEQDNGLLLVQANGDGPLNTSTAFVNDTNWHHIAVVYDQSLDTGEIDLYIDGVLDTTMPDTAGWALPSGGQIYLGQSQDGYWKPYDGMLDDFRIYNRVLTNTEVAAVFASDAVVDTNALVVRLNFDAAPTNGLSLFWLNGGLRSATLANGVFTNVAATTSPWAVIPSSPQKYYEMKNGLGGAAATVSGTSGGGSAGIQTENGSSARGFAQP